MSSYLNYKENKEELKNGNKCPYHVVVIIYRDLQALYKMKLTR